MDNGEFFQHSNRNLDEITGGAAAMAIRAAASGDPDSIKRIIAEAYATARDTAFSDFYSYIEKNYPELSESDFDEGHIIDSRLEDIFKTVDKNATADIATGVFKLRTELAVHAAVRYSYNTSMELMYAQLEEKGLSVSKTWHANFSRETPPCDKCIALHGEIVDVMQLFYVTDNPFEDGLHPPAHPRCRCYITYAVGGEVIPVADPTGLSKKKSMWSSEVKKLSTKVFRLVKATFRAIGSRFKRG